MMRVTIFLLVALLTTTVTIAEQGTTPATLSCGSGPARSLDFWIGRWDVHNAAGQVTAESVVEKIADGCGILERYTGRPGAAGNRYIGAGLHVFDAETSKWRQLWSDTRPAVVEMSGHVTDSGVVYEWDVPGPQGQRIPKRYTLSRFEEGVRQLGERSDDQGKTWATEFDLRYRRMAG